MSLTKGSEEQKRILNKSVKKSATAEVLRLGTTTGMAEFTTIAKPIGTFASGRDWVFGFHDGKLVAADTGDQGGVKTEVQLELPLRIAYRASVPFRKFGF
ncbi:MAG: hypothetical protein WB696_30660 [Chthoniobacterales bacterium]